MAVLTVSREYGSGGKEIGREVAKEMGYTYVDRKLILEDMKAAGGQWEDAGKHFDENNPEVWERFKWSFRGYVALIQFHILGYAAKDNVVIMGRGGNFLLKDIPYVLTVRTIAPMEKRIEKVVEWQDSNSENAEWLIEKADKEMAGSVYLIYGKSWDDPQQYDMVFDTSLQTQREMTDIIKDELKRRELLDRSKSRQILDLRVLAAKMNAEIATDPDLHVSSLKVELKEGDLVEYGLTVKGAVHFEGDIPRIKELVGKLAGNTPVEYGLKYRWHSRLGPWK
jgi:cytidylate kinase